MTALRSRISTSAIDLRAASARSRHSATLICGTRDSAKASKASARTASVPSSSARRFCSSISFRTAAMPPRETCSAITRCSSGSPSIRALRCVRPGLSFFGLGLEGASAFGFRGLASLDPFRPLSSRSRPAPLGFLSLPSFRRRPSLFFPERPFLASCVVTP